MNYRAFKHFFDILNTFLEKSIVGKERFMTSNIDFWNEGLRTFHPICVVLLLFNKTLRGRGELERTGSWMLPFLYITTSFVST